MASGVLRRESGEARRASIEMNPSARSSDRSLTGEKRRGEGGEAPKIEAQFGNVSSGDYLYKHLLNFEEIYKEVEVLSIRSNKTKLVVCFDAQNQRLVVVKVTPLRHRLTAHMLPSLWKEGVMLTKAQKVVGVPLFYDQFVIGSSKKMIDSYVLVQEYIKYPNLDNYISALGVNRLPRRTIVYFGRFIFRILADLHKEGIVHRDIKPENVIMKYEVPQETLMAGLEILSSDEEEMFPETPLSESPYQFWLIDFGLSCSSDPNSHVWNPYDANEADSISTRCRGSPGTPVFMSPELLMYRNNSATLSFEQSKAADVWAAALSVMELQDVGYVTDRFQSFQEIVVFLAKQIEFPEDIDRDPLYVIIRRCLDNDWSKRCTAEEAWIAFEEMSIY